jgi:hypothetical protein
MISDLEKRIDIAECKVWFIQEVRSKKIEITWTEKKIIDHIGTNAKHFAKHSKMLLDMPVRSMTEENCLLMKDLIKKMKKEKSGLELKTNVDIWAEDISKMKDF